MSREGCGFINLDYREPLIIPNLSLPRRRESSNVKTLWIPAFAGMTFLEVAYSIGGVVQLVRAPACHVGGCGFDPRRSRHFKSPVQWTGLLCINVWDTQSTFSRATETVVFTSAILPVWTRGYAGIMKDGALIAGLRLPGS